ncbi:MAG: hypothetical protein WD208_01925 [Dehalococcoidia bacterium]
MANSTANTLVHSGAVTLALSVIALVLALIAIFVPTEPVDVGFDHPDRMAFYQTFSLLLAAGSVVAGAAIVTARSVDGRSLRMSATLLGATAFMANALLLLLIAGACGPGVFRGMCMP